MFCGTDGEYIQYLVTTNHTQKMQMVKEYQQKCMKMYAYVI